MNIVAAIHLLLQFLLLCLLRGSQTSIFFSFAPNQHLMFNHLAIDFQSNLSIVIFGRPKVIASASLLFLFTGSKLLIRHSLGCASYIMLDLSI